MVAPKKETADAALASLNEKQLALSSAQEKLFELQKLLLKLNEDFEKKMVEKEQLIKKVNIQLLKLKLKINYFKHFMSLKGGRVEKKFTKSSIID